MKLSRVRRWVQVLFLLLFVGLVLAARPIPGAEPSPWLKAFFWIDPLVLVSTALAAHAVPLVLLGSLGTLALTVLLGRVFCGWVCPLGTAHAMAGRVCDRFQRRRREHWSPWQRAKYYLLAGLLVMGLLGGHWVAIFDPLVLLYRTTATALAPGLQWAAEEGSTTVYQADPGVGTLRLVKVTEPAYQWLRDNVLVTANQSFLGGGLILAVFMGLLLLNAWRRRFWCRYLCPLGALLGMFSWRPLLQRKTEQGTCNQCDLCAVGCHGAAGAGGGQQWMPAECFGCQNCTGMCPRTSLGFTMGAPWQRDPAIQRVDLSKRALLASAAGGAAALCLMRINPQSRAQIHNPALIRPPGARPELEFLQRCTGCGMCMKVCQTGGLQPTLTEAGLEGLWTPHLVPQIGYCHYNCNLCGQVCPTEAIRPLEMEEKQKVRIGLASFDTTRCIPYAYGRDCMVCEEHCPIPDKAIYCLDVEITDRQGQKKTIKQPKVDPVKCIGCGICENVCPFKDRPGVRVTSANEDRHPAKDGKPGNQPILPEENPYG